MPRRLHHHRRAASMITGDRRRMCLTGGCVRILPAGDMGQIKDN
jgi:hypothetical protein